MPKDRKPRPQRWTRREFVTALAAAPFAGGVHSRTLAGSSREVFLAPNFHPASCGWLTTFSRERVYCANSYLNHLARVRDDPNYSFVLSEVNNIIAIMNFKPGRRPELKRRISERRVERANWIYLEATANLSA